MKKVSLNCLFSQIKNILIIFISGYKEILSSLIQKHSVWVDLCPIFWELTDNEWISLEYNLAIKFNDNYYKLTQKG